MYLQSQIWNNIIQDPVTRGNFLHNLQCNADNNETLQVVGRWRLQLFSQFAMQLILYLW